MKKKFKVTVYIKGDKKGLTKGLPNGGLGEGVISQCTLTYNLKKLSDYKSPMFSLALVEQAEDFVKESVGYSIQEIRKSKK